MTTKTVATISKISVRTLHHYDSIGLLSPKRDKENGYRYYSEQDLDRLQQIMLFKECGFPLEQIKAILSNPEFDLEKGLELQKKVLTQEKKRLSQMINTINKTILYQKGETTMTQNEKFKGLNLDHNPYEEEARKLYGDETIDKTKQHLGSISKKEKEDIMASMDGLFSKLATLRAEKPDSAIVQQAMEEMFQFFNNSFGHTYSFAAFAGLGQLYVSDERFTKNINQYGEGLAEFLKNAMSIYQTNNQ